MPIHSRGPRLPHKRGPTALHPCVPFLAPQEVDQQSTKQIAFKNGGGLVAKKARSHCDPSFFLCCVRDPDLAPQGVSISSPYPPSPVGTGPCACPLIQLTTKSVGSRFRSCQPWMPKLSAKMRKSAKSIVKVSEAVSPSASNALNVEVASAITLGGLLDRVRVVGSNDSPSGEDMDQHPTGSYRVFPRAKWGCGSWVILFLIVCIPLHIRDE